MATSPRRTPSGPFPPKTRTRSGATATAQCPPRGAGRLPEGLSARQLSLASMRCASSRGGPSSSSGRVGAPCPPKMTCATAAPRLTGTHVCDSRHAGHSPRVRRRSRCCVPAVEGEGGERGGREGRERRASGALAREKCGGWARVRFGDPRRGGDARRRRGRSTADARERTSATVHQHVAVIHPRTTAPQAHSAVHEPRAVPPSVPRGVPLRETVVARVRLGLVGAKAPRRRRVRLERRKPHRARRAYSPRPRDGRSAPPNPDFRRAHQESGKRRRRRASRQQRNSARASVSSSMTPSSSAVARSSRGDSVSSPRARYRYRISIAWCYIFLRPRVSYLQAVAEEALGCDV